MNSGAVKYDKGKVMAGITSEFSLALMEVMKVATMGAEKYARSGWQYVEEGQTRYTDAMWRHLLQAQTQELDEESGLMHYAHFVWNALATLELKLREEYNNEKETSQQERINSPVQEHV